MILIYCTVYLLYTHICIYMLCVLSTKSDPTNSCFTIFIVPCSAMRMKIQNVKSIYEILISCTFTYKQHVGF